MTNFKTRDWLPQEPWQGPPLPEFLAIYWPWYKPPETLGAELAIALSADSNALVPGTTYPAIVTVTNKSTKRGVASPATFTVKVGAVLAGVNLDAPISQQSSFAAGEPKTFTFYQFTIPADGGGKSGSITATVFDPAGIVLKVATLLIAVQAAVAPTGILGDRWLYYEGLPSWETFTSGREVPVGVPIYLAPNWKNTSSVNIVGHIDLVMGATVLTSTQNNNMEAAPGSYGPMVVFSPVTFNTAGTYTFTVTLSSGGVLLDTKTFTLVAVQVGVVTGKITTIAIDLGLPLTNWFVPVSGEQVPVNTKLSLYAGYQNTSSVPIVGHVDMLVILPNGTNVYLTAATGQDISVVPGSTSTVAFGQYNMDQEGTYSISITLSSGGVVLDSRTFTLVAVAEIVYGADVVISV